MRATTVLGVQIALLALLTLPACGWIDELGKDSSRDTLQSTAAPVADAGAQTTGQIADSGMADEQATAMAAAAADVMVVALSGQNEVPANPSTASGTAQVAFDPATRTLSWNVSYEGLSGIATAAHFHGPAGVGENAGVQLNIGDGGLASPLIGAAQISEQQAADLMAGRWYINVHSPRYPDGEIRGQVEPNSAM